MAEFEFNADVGDEESETGDGWQYGGKDATIFLIDASPPMFKLTSEEDTDGDSPFMKSLRCAHSTVCRKIISNDQDYYAVVLFNTSQSKNAIDFPNIYVLQDIDRPGAERVLELENLLEDKSGKRVIEKCGSTNKASIHDILWVCRNILIGCKTKLSSKNVLLFTCQDNPHENDEHKKRQALKGAKDLKEGGIEMEILPLGDTFNFEKFYKELLSQGEEDDGSQSLSILADPTDRFDELLERVRRFEHKQRSSGRVSFFIAPGVEMGVKVYTSIRKTYKPSKKKLYKVTNEEIEIQRKEYLEDGELLMPSDFVKYQQYGGRKLKFTLDELRAMRKVYQPGIELLGFKPLSCFKPYLYIKPANFIYPDEASVKGSSKLFACLLERCIKRKVCPLARVTPREGSSVGWAFLLPQEEEKDEKHCQEKPPGFHICYLPFADDFRNIDLENKTRAHLDQVDAAKDMIKKLHFKYNSDSFENPDIQTHWRNIETLALNRAHLEAVTDYTVPDHKRMEKKAGSLIEQFKSLVLPTSYNAQDVAKKRPPPTPSSTVPSKKMKPDPSSLNVEEEAKLKKADKLTVDMLKSWLQERSIKVTGKKKAQLVQDVYDELQIEV